jgi:hemerythrin
VLQDFDARALPVTDFKWTSAVEIGHPEIDGQHKRLFMLAEAVAESVVKSADHLPDSARLQALVDFSREHFAFEEGLMRSAGYPEAERHAKYHVALLSELKTFCARTDRGMDTNPAGLIDFLWAWLLLHIDTSDREMAAWLKSRESIATN